MNDRQKIERLTESVNRLIVAILPIAIVGRNLPPTYDPEANTATMVDMDDRALRRAWNAVRFATDNMPDQTSIGPPPFDAVTDRILRAYGLDRSSLLDQVVFLASIIDTQQKQLAHWQTEEDAREERELAADELAKDDAAWDTATRLSEDALRTDPNV